MSCHENYIKKVFLLKILVWKWLNYVTKVVYKKCWFVQSLWNTWRTEGADWHRTCPWFVCAAWCRALACIQKCPWWSKPVWWNKQLLLPWWPQRWTLSLGQSPLQLLRVSNVIFPNCRWFQSLDTFTVTAEF